MTPTTKKLIEVALPLDAINKASAREKSIRHGHPSTLHLWWARRPLAAARAVIFAQMVDDPSAHPDLFPTEAAQDKERRRLFKIIERLVPWESTTDEDILTEAREEIWKSWRRTCAENADHPRAAELFDRHALPAFHDPFAGGGALPLEAQRLGLEAHASDLNPVAVLINKAMIEIPPKFAGQPPVNPEAREKAKLATRKWKGAEGLAEDVRYYGQWMRDEAEKRIGHLYPPIEVTSELAEGRPDLEPYVGRELTVIAWLWARTVKSPNPAFAHVDVPLASTFMLATKKGKEAWIEPVVEGDTYRFTIRTGPPDDPEAVKAGTKLGRGSNFRCLLSGTPISGDYIKAEGQAGRMGARMMAIVAEGDRQRVYLPPTEAMESIAEQAEPEWAPPGSMIHDARAFTPFLYGLAQWKDLFTCRQLVLLITLSDLLHSTGELVEQHVAALCEGSNKIRQPPSELPGHSAIEYSIALATYLGLAVSRTADRGSTLCSWDSSSKMEALRNTFGRHALSMVWDFAEGNPFSRSSGNWLNNAKWVSKAVRTLPTVGAGDSQQADAMAQRISFSRIVSTDPPYYDNIPYSDLSDFFYTWLRRSLKRYFPELFATVAVPKEEELVATPGRHGGKEKAEAFFLTGMTQAMRRLAEHSHSYFPVTIYYAFKQSESSDTLGTSSTGWETFLGAVIDAGFAITGTWPIRTELSNRMRSMKSNALATSVVLVCRQRPQDAPTASRREFLNALKTELPEALAHLQRGNIAPVDLAQAAIGPGMAVYSRYSKVLDAAGKPVTVRDALAMINQGLDEVLAEQEGDFDADTRWALAWFEQSGFAEGDYGVAETLSKAKNTSVAGMVEAGILASKAGKVRLLQPEELPADWDPTTDTRLTVWETVHHLVRAMGTGGEAAAAALVAKLGGEAEVARELAYRLYTLCERKKRAGEALGYNALVQSWPEIGRLALENRRHQQSQINLFGGD